MIDKLSWIAIDWGSTHLRAYAMTQDNQLLNEKTSSQGMGSLTPTAFEPALLSLIADWLPPVSAGSHTDQPVSVIACGMVGARQGWQEAPYQQVPCQPISTSDMISVSTQDHRIDVKILAGVCQSEPADIMRGEETQIAGLIAETQLTTGTVCLPGTHSKWVTFNDGEIEHFATYMTGEVFSLLSQQSMLRHTVSSDDWDEAAFIEGVTHSIEKPEDLLSNCFRLRARDLLQDLAAASARSHLSGLIIGAELAGAQALFSGRPIALIGEPVLSDLYAQALHSLDISSHIFDPKQLTLQGLTQAYQTLVSI